MGANRLDELVAAGKLIKAGPKLYIVKPHHQEHLVASEIFTSTAAQALKETLEEIIGDEEPLSCSWTDVLRNTAHAANDALVCECGSGSSLVGPGHSNWCQCFEADHG